MKRVTLLLIDQPEGGPATKSELTSPLIDFSESEIKDRVSELIKTMKEMGYVTS